MKLMQLTLIGALGLGLSGCGTLSNLGQGAVRGVTEASESIAGRLTTSGAPDVETELVELPNGVPIDIVAKLRVTDGTPRTYPKPLPAFDGHQVFTLSESRREVFAHRLTDGKRLWKTDLKTSVSGGVGAGDGMVLVGTGSGEVIALAAAGGEERWRSQVDSEVLAPPTARSGVVVVATGDGHLFGLDIADGARRWSVERDVPTLSLRGGSAPLTTDGNAVHGFADGHLMMVDLLTGREAWDTPIVQPRGRTELERMVDADCQPVIEGGAIFAATFQGRISSIDLSSGSATWAREFSCSSALAADWSNVYASDTNDKVAAFDLSSGVVYWEQEALKGRHLTGPAVLGDYIAVGDIEGYVHLLKATDGSLAGRVRPTKDAFLLAPYVRSGVVYFLSEGGHLFGLRAGP